MNRTVSKRAALPLRLLWALAAVLLLVSACGSDDTASSPTPAPTTDAAPATDATAATQAPTTTTEAAAEAAKETEEAESVEETEDTEPPAPEPEYQYQRIVSISPTGTEILFAIGAGDRVVAVDEFSYYPPEAPVTDLSGWQPNVEAIASYDPDLVVMGSDGDIEANLDSLGIAVLPINAPATFDDVYVQIAQFGETTEQADEAAALISEMRDEIAALIDAAPDASG